MPPQASTDTQVAPSNLILAKKGLLLVSAPIIVQFVLIGTLSALETQANDEFKQTMHAREVMELSALGLRRSFPIAKALSDAVTNIRSDGDSPAKPLPPLEIDGLTHSLQDLSRLVVDDGDIVNRVNRLIANNSQAPVLKAEIDKATALAWHHPDPLGKHRLYEKANDIGRGYLDLLKLENEHKEFFKQGLERLAMVHTEEKKIFNIGTALTIALLFVLSWFVCVKVLHR
jgi:hypothetical protein